MKTNNQNIVFGLIVFIFFTITIVPFPWTASIENIIIDLQFKIRGERYLSDEFVFVFIGDEDLKSLGQYPISRDYYSYAIHILKSKGAKVIAIDVLFSQKDKYHPEYDQTLVEFVKSADNVCFPMTFSELIETDSLYRGINPNFPFEELNQSASGVGFSNFSENENVRSVPLFVFSQNNFIPSLGSEIAKIFIGNDSIVHFNEGYIGIKEDFSNAIDGNGFMRLNHFGSIDYVNSIGFVDLLQKYKNDPDSLNFEGKLVLIAVTANGIANLKSTTFDIAFPSSLIHLTVAENLINQNYLVETSIYINLFILIILFAVFWFTVSLFNKRIILTSILLIVSYLIVSMLLFSFSNLAFPVFYPTIMILSLLIFQIVFTVSEKQQMNDALKDLLQTQLNQKEHQLQTTIEKLKDLNAEIKNESESKEKLNQKVNEYKTQALQLEKEIRDLIAYDSTATQQLTDISGFENIIFSEKSKMAQVLQLVTKVATSDIPVLIYGETGTGKELIARAIHQKSNRKIAPFVAVNCGALPENLLESELFGHEKGSFTGAVTMRKGKFELADGGVIFLDEISETSPAFQAKMLRVLQESTFERVGSEKSIKVDIRVIAATNKDLQIEINQGRFRSDLFFRLNGFPITIPPLRERPEDIPLLVTHFLGKYDYNISCSELVLQIIQNYSWFGNVRELENIIRRAAIMTSAENSNLIQVQDLPEEIKIASLSTNLEDIHKSFEEQILESLRTLKFSRSSISQTAKLLGNKDRGTITEYFRGICFQILTENDFDIVKSSRQIAGSNDKEIIAQVEVKINEYLNNLKSVLSSSNSIEFETLSKGLPKKYQDYLKSVITYLSNLLT